MLEEFILDQLSVLSVRKEELSEQLDKLTAEEQKESEAISLLLAKDDFNFDLFSPRAAGHGMKQEVEAIQKRIETIRFQQTEIRQQIEEVSENEDRYQKLLSEARLKKLEADEMVTDVGTDDNISDDSGDDFTGDRYNQITLKLVDDEKIERLKQEHLHELETLLKRVNNCYDLALTDPVRSRNELNNLRYYLKARISALNETITNIE